MRPITVSVGPLTAPSATNIRTAGAIAGAGAVTLDGTTVSGGTATLDAQRRVIFTSSGNDTGITFAVVGTDGAGNPLSETVTGANAAAASTVLDYKTLSSVISSGAAAGTVSIGTNGLAASPWARLDDWGLPNLSIQSVVVGTINYTIQQTYDDPNSPTNPVAASAVTWSQLVAAASASAIANVAYAPVFVRVLVNSNTNPGSVTTTFLQTGVTPK